MRTRLFNHADLPEIIRIWHLHHQQFDPGAQVTVAAMEAALFAKPWFDPNDFFLFEAEDEVRGFCHLLRRDGETIVGSVCCGPETPEIALLTELETLLDEAVQGPCRAGVTLQDDLGYIGLSTTAGIAGLNERDPAAHRWLPKLGFELADSYHVYDQSLENYRPPIDRETLFLRRISETKTNENFDEPSEQRRWAFSHLQRLVFNVSDGRGNTMGTADFVMPDNAVCGPLPTVATLLHLEAPAANARDRWTMMSSAESLSRAGMIGMRVCWHDAEEPAEWIAKLGFHLACVGHVLRRPGKD